MPKYNTNKDINLRDLTYVDAKGDLVIKTSSLSNSDYDIIDDTDANNVYVGWFQGGTGDESKTMWKIKKIYTNGNIVRTYWANGNMNFDKEWDERAGYIYTYLSK